MENETRKLLLLLQIACDRKAKITACINNPITEAAVNEASESLQSLKDETEHLKSKKSEAKKKLSMLEKEADAFREKALKEEKRMMAGGMRSAKEVQSVNREVELLKSKAEKLDEEAINHMESIENYDARLSELKSAIENCSQEIEEKSEEHRDYVGGLKKELECIEIEIDDTRDSIEGSIIALYDKIFQKKGGTAVARSKDGVCSGCSMRIPTHRYEEFLNSSEICLCPNCGRILSSEEENEGVENG